MVGLDHGVYHLEDPCQWSVYCKSDINSNIQRADIKIDSHFPPCPRNEAWSWSSIANE